MKPFAFNEDVGHVLFVGAHCDDVEIGCGGTLCALALARPSVRIHIAVFSSPERRAAETRAAIEKLLPNARYELELFDFRDGFFPQQWAQIKERFEQLKSRCQPDVIFTHYCDDKHQDHRILSELTWNTFRNHSILEYEIPKYDGDLGRPNVYMPLADEIVRRKVAALLESFPSQVNKRWFTEELFRSLMRLRGMECNSSSGYAEAYYARKSVVSW